MSFIRTLFFGFLVMLAMVLAFWMVYSNGQPETVRLEGLMGGQGIWNPFAKAGESQIFMLPLGMWYLAFTFVGIFIGMFISWFMAGGTRIRARQQGRRARMAEKELTKVKKETEVKKQEVDSLKTEKKDLESKVKQAEAVAISAPTEVKQLTSSL